jgi:hypothetical protein
VTVSQPDSASVSIGVEFASEPPISYSTEDDPYWTDMLGVIIGTGPSGVTIRPDGVEAEFYTGLHGATLDQHLDQGVDLRGDEYQLEGTAQAAVDGSMLTLTFTRESLGDPEQMMFIVMAGREIGNGEEGGGGDVYPENDGIAPPTQMAWTFQDE